MDRRHFLAFAGLLPFQHTHANEKPVSVRAITKGPRFHWFGYYDKLQFDPSGQFCLGMQVDFEHRSPKKDDLVQIGMIDLRDHDRWIPLGRSSAWNWQQGCMLQWRPGSATEVMWNDRDGDRYVCRILDVKTKAERVIPHPIYAVSPDGTAAVSPDFRRLADTRPGYGYNGIADPYMNAGAPDQSGISYVDFKTGKAKLIIPFVEMAELQVKASMLKTKHWFNHCLFNPSGTRFVFLHRWKVGPSWQTRMITADRDGKNRRVVDDNGMTSHFIWRDDDHILAWSNQPSHGKRFYLFTDDAKTPPTVVAEKHMLQDGHCTYLPGNEWILCDTYPDAERKQNPYLFQPKTSKFISLGGYRSPKEYAGEWRCDLHPRFSPDGKSVVIDSPHDGGRQLYLIDLNGVI